jgi:uncharacterized repeat protein (TIGR01451 family)
MVSMRRVVGAIVLGAAVLGTALPADAFILTTITIDGNMNDWAAILAQPSQTSVDGPAGGLVDRDAPVQSTGRDLTAFAWTYDATYFYMYIRRTGSASNRQFFWYYLDVNANERMETGEPVFHVSWMGSSRQTDFVLYRYNATVPAGNPMVNGAGFADGYDMPGTLTLVGTTESMFGGSTAGLEMESRISWVQLGVPTATPFYFHVGSSNSTNIPSQLDDNLGGPGGGVGYTFLSGVAFDPDRSTTCVAAGDAVLAHTVRNLGNANDTFDLTWTSSGAFVPTSVRFYRDVNADGRLDPGDVLLTDTDGDLVVDTGVVGVGVTLPVLVVATLPGGVTNGQTATVVATAKSSLPQPTSDTVTDVITVATPGVTLVKSVSAATAVPGTVLTYTVAYTSNGTTSAYNVVVVDAVPANTLYLTGSAAGSGATITYSHDGGATFDASETAPVTHLRWSFAASMAAGTSGTVTFRATVR